MSLISNVSQAGIHCLIPGPPVRQQSKTNPRPPRLYVAMIAISANLWIPGFSLLYVMYSDPLADSGPSIIVKRKGGVGGGLHSGSGEVDMVLVAAILGTFAL